MIGKIVTTESGFKSCEIYEADNQFIYKIADILVDRFEFQIIGVPVAGLDEVYWNFSKDGTLKLTLGWDIWSGCCGLGSTVLMKHIW